MKTVQEKLKEMRQFRTMEILPVTENKRFETDYYIEGYATTFEPYKLTEDREGDIYEHFTRETFKDADMSDVIFQYNHEGRVFARLSNDTLALEVDDHGLKVYADLSKSQEGRNLYEEIQNGLTTKMSWGFRLGEYEYDKKKRTIVHKSVKKIFDVSAVSIPANDGTEISARNFTDGVFEKLQAERLKHEALLLDIEIELERGKK